MIRQILSVEAADFPELATQLRQQRPNARAGVHRSLAAGQVLTTVIGSRRPLNKRRAST